MKVAENRYVPEGYELVARDEGLGLEVFADKTRNVAMGFSGRRNKPDFNYRFKNAEKMQAYIEEFVVDVIGRAKVKENRKAERLAANRNAVVKVGDIFRASWGYDQTNIDYYEVVAVKNQMIDVRKIGQIREYDGYDCGKCAPVPGEYIGEANRYKAQSGYGGNGYYIKIASYAHANKMEPIAEVAGVKVYQPSYWSSYA